MFILKRDLSEIYNMQVSFTLFSDLHYKKGMYAATVDDLLEIFSRAEKSGSQFVMHLGDLCNDYKGSPELVNAYIKNKQGLPVYGVYGNHELESDSNSMELVTPLLTNDKTVVWGTKDGSFNPEIAYYHKDFDSYRFIFTDTNYSVTPEGEFEHNRTGSWGPPSENKGMNCLGDAQFKWLKNLLFDGADKNMKCVVFSHAAFAEGFSYSTDSEKMRKLFSEVNSYKKNTVIASINGHWHANAYEIKDNILYFNTNSAKNGCWLPVREAHYLPEHTYPYLDFDKEGNLLEKTEKPINDLSMALNTWFFDRPLSTSVTFSEGEIKIDGMTTNWMYDLPPVGERVSPNRVPFISEVSFKYE